MMKVNYTKLIKNIKGASIPKPLSGTLSGHAAGEPFDKHVTRKSKSNSQVILSGSMNI